MPHRHLDPTKDESIICLRGCLGVVVFCPSGAVDRNILLAAAGGNVGVDIPHGVYHTVLALEPGTVFFEAKAGPFVPLTAAERAAWAPAEGDPAATDFLVRWRRLFD